MFKQSELELLDPVYANRSSAAPVVLRARDLAEEIKAALILMQDTALNFVKEGREHPHRGCIAIAGHSFYEVSIFGEMIGIPVLDGTAGLKEGSLFLSDLEQTKGYEFDTVVVVNCCSGILPPKGVPEADAFRFGCQLYVAMTRAKTQLVLSFSSEASPWLKAKGVNIAFDEWDNFVDLAQHEDVGAPGYLPERVDAETNDIMSLNGRDFLFTPYALGIKPEIQEKLEQLVSGETVMRGRHRVAWKNVGLLLDDLASAGIRGRTGFIFGPAADEEVHEILDRAAHGLRPMARKRRPHIPPASTGATNVVDTTKSRKSSKPKAELIPLSSLGLTLKTHVTLHEMKVRTIADIVRLGHYGLVENDNLGQWQIGEIREALAKFGKQLPLGEEKKSKRRRPIP
jgi:hypothetical protein